MDDPDLYIAIKEEVKRSVKAWPSAYGSGLLVQKYKAAGGTYSGRKPGKKTGLSRWFAEKWVDVCAYPEVKACGRPKGGYDNYEKEYPYCRPLVRVNANTPKTVRELTASQRKAYCARKRSSPKKKMKKA